MARYGIFTKPVHVEKIVNFLNKYTTIDYIISTEKEEIYAYDFDIGISYCWPIKIDVSWPHDLIIRDGKQETRIWYNYHPALLPEYAGMGSYAKALHDGVKEFGVTLHIMTSLVDHGPILCIKRFKLDSLPVHTTELGCITHYYLFQLFKETIETLSLKPVSKEDFEKRCAVKRF